MKSTFWIVCALALFGAMPVSQASAKNYRVVVVGARLLPVKASGNCWDLCSRKTSRKLKAVADQMAKVVSFQPAAVNAAFAAATRGMTVYMKGARMPDPYVKVQISTGHAFRTQVIKDTITPKWNSSELTSLSPTSKISLEVWDKDISRDDLIGRLKPRFVPSTYLKNGGTWRLRFGQVYELTLMVVPVKQKVVKTFKPGVYRVLIHGANIDKKKANGSGWDPFGGRPDPYVVLVIGRHRIVTPVAKNTLSPQWSFFKQLFLTGTERLIYYVYDKDTLNKDDLIGSCAYQQVSHVVLRYQSHYRHRCQSIREIRISFERVK